MPKVGNRETKPRKTRFYQSADELQKKIAEYFKNPHTKSYIYKGEKFEVYAMTAEYIAINHLGFKTKQSLYDYRNRYKGEGYDEVINGMLDQLIDYWCTAGEHGNGAFAAWVLSSLRRDKEQIAVKKDATPIETASSIIEAALKNDISLETMQKLMQAVKARADIEKNEEVPQDSALTINIIDAVKDAD